MRNGWQTGAFEECIDKVTYSQKIQRKDFLDDGAYPVISQEETFINGYWNDEADLFKVSTPIVVFGDHTKILKYVDFDFVLGADGVKILQPRKFLLPKFFYYQLQSADLESLGYARHYKLLRELQIAYPPLPEQQRIVDILDEAFGGIATAQANAEKNLQNARALFASHLNSVFTQRGAGWVEKPLGELCERITKGSSPKWQGISYVDQPGVLFVTSENVGEFEILIDRPKYVEWKFNIKDKKSILKRGDVLTNIVGASIGRTAVFDMDEVANINQAVCVIRCLPQLLHNSYLTYLLNSPVVKQVLHDNEVNTARANLSLTFFSELGVPLPSVSEQREIVEKLDSFRVETQRVEAVYQQKLAALEELKKSLLHQAFTGQLTMDKG